MGFWYWFRVAMMSIGLLLTIMAIRNLNQAGPAQSPSRTATVIQGVNLCPTRVTRLEAGKVAVFQDGMSWFRDGAKHKEKLDDVAVEKWFSRHCQVTGTRVSPSADVQAALKVYFVNGEPLTLLKSADGEYEWMGLPFRSVQMDDALKELLDLPAKEALP